MSPAQLLLRSAEINFFKKSLQNHCRGVSSDLLAEYILVGISKSKCRQDTTSSCQEDSCVSTKDKDKGTESRIWVSFNLCLGIQGRAVSIPRWSGCCLCVTVTQVGTLPELPLESFVSATPWDFSPYFQPRICVSSTPLQAEDHFWEMLWQFLYP